MLSYPQTNYNPPPTLDLSSLYDREKITGGAIKAFFNIMTRWNISDEDARQLLRLQSSTYYKYKKTPPKALDQDQLTRISYLTGIFKALNILHGEKLADKWIAMVNANPIFKGTTPLDYMIKGGTPAMDTVRRLLDARRGYW